MARPVLLAFVLVILIITSQFEWRQPLVADLDATPSLSQKGPQISSRVEAVKEKIILSQERRIQKLNGLVQSLQQQLAGCRVQNEGRNESLNHQNVKVIEMERKQILDD